MNGLLQPSELFGSRTSWDGSFNTRKLEVCHTCLDFAVNPVLPYIHEAAESLQRVDPIPISSVRMLGELTAAATIAQVDHRRLVVIDPRYVSPIGIYNRCEVNVVRVKDFPLLVYRNLCLPYIIKQTNKPHDSLH